MLDKINEKRKYQACKLRNFTVTEFHNITITNCKVLKTLYLFELLTST